MRFPHEVDLVLHLFEAEVLVVEADVVLAAFGTRPRPVRSRVEPRNLNNATTMAVIPLRGTSSPYTRAPFARHLVVVAAVEHRPAPILVGHVCHEATIGTRRGERIAQKSDPFSRECTSPGSSLSRAR